MRAADGPAGILGLCYSARRGFGPELDIPTTGRGRVRDINFRDALKFVPTHLAVFTVFNGVGSLCCIWTGKRKSIYAT